MNRVFLNKQNKEEVVEKAKSILCDGGVILYPTDTVYGLGADAFNKRAVEHIRDIKGRKEGKPFLVMVDAIETLKKYAEVNTLAEHFIKKFWPGALTIILRSNNKELIGILGSGDGRVGFRMPKHSFCLELLKNYSHPIISTSANISGEVQPNNVSDILQQLFGNTDDIDLVVDEGPILENIPSTIIDLSDGVLKVVREGRVLL